MYPQCPVYIEICKMINVDTNECLVQATKLTPRKQQQFLDEPKTKEKEETK